MNIKTTPADQIAFHNYIKKKIKYSLADEIGKRQAKEFEEHKKKGLKITAEQFFTMKLFNNPSI